MLPVKEVDTLTWEPENVRMKLPKGEPCDWLRDAMLLLSMN